MRYNKVSKKSFTANIFFAFVFMIIFFLIAYSFVFPYETELAIKTEKQTENELLYMECDIGYYEEVMKNSNYINGGEMYQVGKKVYSSPMSDKRQLRVYVNDGFFEILDPLFGETIGEFEWVYQNLPGTPILCNGYWVIVSDDFIIIGDNAEPYRCQVISFSWKDQVTTDGKYDYSKIMEILKRQHIEKTTLADMAVLLGATQEGVLLNFNGDYAVFAKRSKNSDNIDFVRCFADGTSENFGPYLYSKKNSVISFDKYVCFTTEKAFYWLDLDTGKVEEKQYTNEGKKSRVIFHGYYERNGKYDYMFGTEEITGIVYGKKQALDGKVSVIPTPHRDDDAEYDEMNVWYLDHSFNKTDICLSQDTIYYYKTIKKGK